MKKYVMTLVLVCLPVGVAVWQGGMAALGITESGLQTQIERATRGADGGLSIPNLGATQLAAAKALPEAEQVALMRELATAAKGILMSPAFQSAHDAYIATKYKAVNHGIKVTTLEQAASRGAADGDLEAQIMRQMAAVYVDMAMQTPMEDLKVMFDASVADWTRSASRAKGADGAKYAKLLTGARAIQDLSVSNPDKFRRGYAVLRSAENDGPDTEAALFGAQASTQKDSEQQMWDTHNLRGALKRGLAQIVAEAPTVDFAAQTVQKGSVRVFVDPAYEKKSLTWKAMYRAGKGPAAAGVAVAKAWLLEL